LPAVAAQDGSSYKEERHIGPDLGRQIDLPSRPISSVAPSVLGNAHFLRKLPKI
jgi:hypothetical protein